MGQASIQFGSPRVYATRNRWRSVPEPVAGSNRPHANRSVVGPSKTLPSVRTTHGTTNSDERRKRSRRSLGG